MKVGVATIILASCGSIFCSGAWAWSGVGDKVQFTQAEWNFCRVWESDAAAVMLWRQHGNDSPAYVDDITGEPSDFDKRRREYFVREAMNYQVAATPEEQMSIAEMFSAQMRNRCFGVVTSTPSSKEP